MTLDFHEGVFARTILAEAGGESDDGKLGVANVIVNRQIDGRWGKTIASVCLWPMQFSCWNDHFRSRIIAVPDLDLNLARCVAIMNKAVKLHYADPTFGATHYYAPALVAAPAWTVGATQTATIGGHVFFKGVK